MTYQAEVVKAKSVNKRQRIGGNLIDRVCAARFLHAPVAAIIHEHIVERVDIQPGFNLFERVRVTEPTVKNENGVGSLPTR